MEVPVSEAKAQLTELVRRAEAGDEVILTRHGQPAVRLVPLAKEPDRATRRRLLEELRAGAIHATQGRTRPGAKIFSTTMTACLRDRCRHIRAYGNSAG